MDPITFTAIVAALSAGVATGAGKVVETALMDAYQGLKKTLTRKFGEDSEVLDAVDKPEQKPNSEARVALLQEEVETARVDQDPEVRKAAQELLDRVQAQPGGELHVQYARGRYIAQADRSSTATVSVNQPKNNVSQRED
jgi:hypothetical protein